MLEDPTFSVGQDCLYHTEMKVTVFPQDQQPSCKLFHLKKMTQALE